MHLRPAIFLLFMSLALPVWAQQPNIALDGLQHDPSLPIEIGADQLAISQADGSATFTGNVAISQGALKLVAAMVVVEYTEDGQGIRSLHATGGVTFANVNDAAEAREAVYTIETGQIVMTGDVLLTQGSNAISGQKLVIDLTAGTGSMEGRVQTVFQPGGSNGSP